jgi:hypothetical protein
MNPELQKIFKKTQAFLRGLEATMDEFITRTVDRGEQLLQQEHGRTEASSEEPAAQPSGTAEPQGPAA